MATIVRFISILLFYLNIVILQIFCQVNFPESNNSGGSSTNLASYNESCVTEISQIGKLCNSMKNLTCQHEICKCNDKLGVPLIYLGHPDIQNCVSLPTSANNWACNYDQQCRQSSFGKFSRCNIKEQKCECFDNESSRQTVRDEDICYVTKKLAEKCENDKQCNISISGEAICHGATETSPGICVCAANYFAITADNGELKCIELKGINGPCFNNLQCNHVNALGPLARCNYDSRVCECYDMKNVAVESKIRVEYYAADRQTKGKCYFLKGLNETCETSEECILGYHSNAICSSHESYNGGTICKCAPNKSCNVDDTKSGSSENLVLTQLIMIFIIMFNFLMVKLIE